MRPSARCRRASKAPPVTVARWSQAARTWRTSRLAFASLSSPRISRLISLSGLYVLNRASTSCRPATTSWMTSSDTSGGSTTMLTVVPMTCSTQRSPPTTATLIRDPPGRAPPGATARRRRSCTWRPRPCRSTALFAWSASSRRIGAAAFEIWPERRPVGSWSRDDVLQLATGDDDLDLDRAVARVDDRAVDRGGGGRCRCHSPSTSSGPASRRRPGRRGTDVPCRGGRRSRARLDDRRRHRCAPAPCPAS